MFDDQMNHDIPKHWQKLVRNLGMAPVIPLLLLGLGGVLMGHSEMSMLAMFTLFPITFLSALGFQAISHIGTRRGLQSAVTTLTVVLFLVFGAVVPIAKQLISIDSIAYKANGVPQTISREQTFSPLNLGVVGGSLLLSYVGLGFLLLQQKRAQEEKDSITDQALGNISSMAPLGFSPDTPAPHEYLQNWFYQACLSFNMAYDSANPEPLRSYVIPELFEYLKWAIPWQKQSDDKGMQSKGFMAVFFRVVKIPETGADVIIEEVDSANRVVKCRLFWHERRGKSNSITYYSQWLISLKGSQPLLAQYLDGNITVISGPMTANSTYQQQQQQQQQHPSSQQFPPAGF